LELIDARLVVRRLFVAQDVIVIVVTTLTSTTGRCTTVAEPTRGKRPSVPIFYQNQHVQVDWEDM
jgi:hypothetical protein